MSSTLDVSTVVNDQCGKLVLFSDVTLVCCDIAGPAENHDLDDTKDHTLFSIDIV